MKHIGEPYIAIILRIYMTYYSKNEPYTIGVDFDGTITTSQFGGNDFPSPQSGFVKFYNYICEHNIQNPDSPVFMVIHTARDLDDDENWSYVKDYLSRYQLDEIYLPKRDGHTMKNNLDERMDFPTHFSSNSKIPCSCFIDDLNACTPRSPNGDLDWDKILEYVLIDLKKIEKYWEDK